MWAKNIIVVPVITGSLEIVLKGTENRLYE